MVWEAIAVASPLLNLLTIRSNSYRISQFIILLHCMLLHSLCNPVYIVILATRGGDCRKLSCGVVPLCVANLMESISHNTDM